MSQELIIYGKVALLDDEDWERLHSFTWCIAGMRSCFYAVRSVKRKRVYMHHDIIGKPPQGMITDHISRDTLDNRKVNLRHTTYKENALNSSNYLKATYVTFEKGIWRARPVVNGIKVNAGQYPTKEEAIIAVKAFYHEI